MFMLWIPFGLRGKRYSCENSSDKEMTISAHDKSFVIQEPYAVKVARAVLKQSAGG